MFNLNFEMINNIDLIKSISLMYIVPQVIYYIYNYNLSIRKHIKNNEEVLRLIKDIHKNIVKT
jgi:hypothetical protein